MKKVIVYSFFTFLTYIALGQQDSTLLVGIWKKYNSTLDRIFYTKSPLQSASRVTVVYNKDKTMKEIEELTPTTKPIIFEGTWSLKNDTLLHTFRLKAFPNGKTENLYIQRLTKDTLILRVIRIDQENDKIFEKSERGPIFPGGKEALDKIVAKNFNVPKQFLPSSPTEIWLQFVVLKDGAIDKNSIKVLKGYNEQCDKEAIRIMQLLPKWEPAIINFEKFSARIKQAVTLPTN